MGDTAAGGAVRIAVEPVSEVVSLLYDKTPLSQKNGLPRPPNNKTTQGLWYHTFGMDDKRKEGSELRRRQRFYASCPGAQWKIRLTARRSSLDTPGKQAGRAQIPLTDPGLLLQQAQSALWLLCHFGGIGSKSRKGFGSLAIPGELDGWTLERCKQSAGEFRQCGSSPARYSRGLPRPGANADLARHSNALDQLLARPGSSGRRCAGVCTGQQAQRGEEGFGAAAQHPSAGPRLFPTGSEGSLKPGVMRRPSGTISPHEATG